MEDKTHDNINDEVDDDELYELDKLSLHENNWTKHTFERKLKIICYIYRPNVINYIHDNKVNSIAECNLLHDILNPTKHTKI